MRTRVLPPEEWSRLTLEQVPSVLPCIRPEEMEVIVVEDGDRIVACVSVMRMTHLDGVWVAPEYRGNAGVGRRLLRGMRESAERWCESFLAAGASNEHAENLIEKMGGIRMPMDHYVIPVGAR